MPPEVNGTADAHIQVQFNQADKLSSNLLPEGTQAEDAGIIKHLCTSLTAIIHKASRKCDYYSGLTSDCEQTTFYRFYFWLVSVLVLKWLQCKLLESYVSIAT